MSENSRKVLNYLKEAGAGTKFTIKELQKALGIEKPIAIVGSLRSLEGKGYAVRFTEADADGNEIKYFALTDEGVNYNPDAE